MQQKNENVGLRCSAVAPLDLAQDYFSSKEKHTTISTHSNQQHRHKIISQALIYILSKSQLKGGFLTLLQDDGLCDDGDYPSSLIGCVGIARRRHQDDD